MPDSEGINSSSKFEPQSQRLERDRRATARTDTILSRIEDATYAILRKHEKQSA